VVAVRRGTEGQAPYSKMASKIGFLGGYLHRRAAESAELPIPLLFWRRVGSLTSLVVPSASYPEIRGWSLQREPSK